MGVDIEYRETGGSEGRLMWPGPKRQRRPTRPGLLRGEDGGLNPRTRRLDSYRYERIMPFSPGGLLPDAPRLPANVLSEGVATASAKRYSFFVRN